MGQNKQPFRCHPPLRSIQDKLNDQVEIILHTLNYVHPHLYPPLPLPQPNIHPPNPPTIRHPTSMSSSIPHLPASNPLILYPRPLSPLTKIPRPNLHIHNPLFPFKRHSSTPPLSRLRGLCDQSSIVLCV